MANSKDSEGVIVKNEAGAIDSLNPLSAELSTITSSNPLPVTNGFIDFKYDYVSLALTDSVTETYTFKIGGSSGTTVATVTVIYTDSKKCTISSVEKVNA